MSRKELYEWNGESLGLREWSEKLNISYVALRARIKQYGWDIERAFTTPSAKEQIKNCSKCGREREKNKKCKFCETEYYTEYRSTHKSERSILHADWRHKNKEKIKKDKAEYYLKRQETNVLKARKYYRSHKEEAKNYRLLKSFGITFEEYKLMHKRQNGNCAICGKHFEAIIGNKCKTQGLHVDHNHQNGKVRELLCNGCNRGLGLLGDENIKSALAYLNKHV